MTRKTVEMEITNEQATKLFNSLLEKAGESAGFMFEGSLSDEYAVVMTNDQKWKLNLAKGRPILARKYVYIKEVYLNCWSSELVLVLTDNKKKFLSFIKSRVEEAEDLDDFCVENGLND